MLKKEFKEWLENRYSKKTILSRISSVERIDKEYNIDLLYAKDYCKKLSQLFRYSKSDVASGFIPDIDIKIDGDYYSGMATLRQALKLYLEFLSEPYNQVYIQKLLSKNKATESAIFKGSLSDFKLYFRGFCKNKVNAIAKKERDKLNGICECCGQKRTLQAAHLEGEERVAIIEKVLNENFKPKEDEDYYEVNLVEFEKLFVEAHTPIRDHFFFLCSDCHNSYDGKGKNAGQITTGFLHSKRLGY